MTFIASVASAIPTAAYARLSPPSVVYNCVAPRSQMVTFNDCDYGFVPLEALSFASVSIWTNIVILSLIFGRDIRSNINTVRLR